jgi:lysophospholipase L1-like esterase
VSSASTGTRRRITWRGVILIMGAGTLVTLLALELVLQIVTGNLGMPLYDIHPPDGRCVGLRAGTAVPYTGWALRVPQVFHEVNDLGFRGEARRPDAAPDAFRVLMIGDSYTYGQAVAAEQAMAAQLEAVLHEQGQRRVEVLNFGVPGLNLEEDLDQYRKFAAGWRHDLVLLAAADNDLGPPLCSLVSQGATVWIIKHFRLARLYYFVFRSPFGAVDAHAGAPAERLQRVLDGFIETSQAAHARFGLVMLQGHLDGAPSGLVEQITATRATPQLLLQGSKSGFDDIAKIPGEFHFTAEGNREAAVRIARWLRSSGLVRE